MAHVNLIPADQQAAWCDLLDRSGTYDTYHLPGYHLLARDRGEGEPYLFSYEDEGRGAAVPFLLRPLAAVDGLEDCAGFDAVSTYGYPGAITTVDRRDPGAEEFARAFQSQLIETLRVFRVVTFFGRQNPLIDTSWLFQPAAETPATGPTVAIDLAPSEEEQFGGYRRNHRRDLRRARSEGEIVFEDFSPEGFDRLHKLYTQTMERNGAAGYYFFDRAYFQQLRRHLDGHYRLLFSRLGDAVVSGAVFLTTGEIIQHHLAGTDPRYVKHHGGMKLVVDEARRWAKQNGFRWLHLGGGLGATEDAIFNFKAGFSNTRRTFQTVKLIVAESTHEQLIEKRRQWLADQELETIHDNFFPAYRQPARRRAA